MRGWADYLMLQGVWCACVLGAGRGWFWLGPSCAAAALGVHLAGHDRRAAELRAVFAVAALGSLLEAVLLGLGTYRYAGQAVGLLPPAWIVALWAVFAMTFGSALAWLAGRPLLAALLGGLGNPLSMLAGARLGAVDLGPEWQRSLAVIGLAWAAALPPLHALSRRLGAGGAP